MTTKPETTCTRSHPHENMNSDCDKLTRECENRILVRALFSRKAALLKEISNIDALITSLIETTK